jgi:hypothetical protein
MSGQWPEGKTTMTFHVDSSTKITQKAGSSTSATSSPSSTSNPSSSSSQQAKNLELKDLKTGEHATVKYTEKDGQLHAKSIEIQKSATSSE